MAVKNNARLVDPSILIQAGINPKTGLPIKASNGNKSCLKEEIRKALRIIDEQDAINRFKWYNLPDSWGRIPWPASLRYRRSGCPLRREWIPHG